MTTMTDIDLRADVIDVRDIIERFEELDKARGEHWPIEDQASEYYGQTWEQMFPDEAAELQELTALLVELLGMGGDHQWRGDWYPGSLIADSYFEDYARELADDIGAIDSNAGWPTRHIDWKAAAAELATDYSEVEVAGCTYLTR